ncbi:SLAP domain-containing protein [Lysinibacillus sp. 54212]|uniref:SLAP domain-containing protein n=1 Tax=Lysinibacillus sp. 54212 TaxID=3119829 RepID=UPI002FC8F5CE
MQQLQFEAAWDKTLSSQDRDEIQRIFNETKHQNYSTIAFSPIREAINHKEELLITVLVHNFSDNPLIFDHTRLVYSTEQGAIAEKVFSLPALSIPPHTSMPWTFIFPKETYVKKNSPLNGQLQKK